jgi:hypothetical protein
MKGFISEPLFYREILKRRRFMGESYRQDDFEIGLSRHAFVRLPGSDKVRIKCVFFQFLGKPFLPVFILQVYVLLHKATTCANEIIKEGKLRSPF